MNKEPTTFRFGVFEADLGSGELKKRGARVRLADQPFRVLEALIERPGEVVSRDDLRRHLWPDDTFVDFDNGLNTAVRTLRRALGDAADSPRFVETLPKRGYRFIAPVEPVAVWVGAGEGPARRAASRSRWVRGAWLAFAAAGLVVVLGWLMSRDGRQAGASAPDRAMLAVLPLVNLDEDPAQDFFSDGLTEEMIAQLGRLQPERLGVIARTSSRLYADSDKSVEQIGRELGVDYVIEGSVRSARPPADPATSPAARITVRLIQVSDQTYLWTETFDTELTRMLDVQGEIAVEVARVLALELLPAEPLARARSGTRVTGAYEQLLRGRHEWNTFSDEGYRRAIAHFEKAIELDDGYAAAWAGLANAYNLQSFSAQSTPAEAFPKAREAAEAALARDGESAEARAALAFVELYFDYDLEGAELDFRRAIELRPNYAMAHHWHAGALSALERHDEAIAAIRRAVELDPLSLSVLSDAGWYYLFADRYEEAIAECRRTLEIADYGWARGCLTQAYLATGRYDEALEILRPQITAAVRELGLGPRATIETLQRQWLDEKKADETGRSRYPADFAMSAAAAGDLETAFAALGRAYELRDAWLVFLEVDPRFDPLRADRRFAELARRVGLEG